MNYPGPLSPALGMVYLAAVIAKQRATKPPAKPKGQTLRLSEEAWAALKQLALDKRTTSHALLIEALNDLFRKNGRPPIA